MDGAAFVGPAVVRFRGATASIFKLLSRDTGEERCAIFSGIGYPSPPFGGQ